MTTIGTKIQAGFEPIPGYVLTKKLGSGGYGEVWAADAPGGLKKAIKFVFGAIEDDRASAELRSLQRVRQVNHPFILSLERIEIIEGQLIIVTELAQGSLFERYVEYREKGFAGIARDRLMAYLRDAAEGLDFLCQKHELQHLDVKPGNLLLVSDRIKVADFGLVKDLHSLSQSMMGGLTPTYAAPEMFDGRPGRYSDQYSLAIVYQEMLTGTLPFRGRTTAQLANEHLNKAPNLDSLPLEERPVIAKALSKRPQQRFTDCREMVHALLSAHESKSDGLNEKTPRVRGWSPQAARSRQVAPPLEGRFGAKAQLPIRNKPKVLSNQGPKKARVGEFDTTLSRTVIIGVGGVGIAALAEVRKRMATSGGCQSEQPRYVAIDTDGDSIATISDRTSSISIPSTNIVHSSLKSPHYYRDEISPFPQLSRRWLYNIPRSQLTDGVRPLGMLALIDHASKIYGVLTKLFEQFRAPSAIGLTFEIKIVASSMGGTGSAMATEIGFLVRQICAQFQIKIHVELLFTCATPSPTALADLPSASAIATLLEVDHYFRTGGLHPDLPNIPASHSQSPPFEQVRLFYGGQVGVRAHCSETIQEIAEYLLLPDPLPREEVKHAKNGMAKGNNSSGAWLSTLRVSPFQLDISLQPVKAAATVFLRSLLGWLAALDTAVVAAKSSQAVLVPNKSKERIEYLVTDIFRVCNWNAQAWVRDVMIAVLPSDQTSSRNDFRSRLTPSACSIEYIEELKSVCAPLGIDLSESSIALQQLFECRLEKLLETIHVWIGSSQHWAIFPHLLDMIEERIRVNSHSLLLVSKRLNEKFANAKAAGSSDISQIGDPKGADDSSKKESAQRNKAFIESVFHQLSAKMLLKYISRLHDLKRDWLRCTRLLHSEFMDYGNKVSTSKFGYALDQFIQEHAQLKVESLNRIASNSLSEVMIRQLGRTFGCEPLLHFKDGQHALSAALRGESNLSAQLKMIHDTIRSEFLKSSEEASKQTSDSNGIKAVQTAELESPKTVLANLLPSSDANSTPPSSLPTPVRTSFATDSSEMLALNSRASNPLQLEEKLEQSIPYLAEFGESVRMHLYTSEMIWFQLPESMRTEIEKICSVSLGGERNTSTLVAEGTNLDLEQLIDKLWMPTNETWQLVPRVLSRVDIEWIPFSQTSES